MTSDLCLWPSRSDWPVSHYDGRWRCSEPYLHAGAHVARRGHHPMGAVVWAGPWVPEGNGSCQRCKRCHRPVPAGDEWRISGLCQACLNGPAPDSPDSAHHAAIVRTARRVDAEIRCGSHPDALIGDLLFLILGPEWVSPDGT